MKNLVFYLLMACLFMLVGAGLQWFFYGLTGSQAFQFETYSFFGWVLQACYWGVCILLPTTIDEEPY